MKLKKLLYKTETFFQPDKSTLMKEQKDLKKVLKKLSNYEKKLNNELFELMESSDLNAEEQERIEKVRKVIALTHVQRIKGLNMLDELKSPAN